MGNIKKFLTNKKIDNFINDYSSIINDYEEKHGESLNKEPFSSINDFPLKECKYKVSIIISSWNCSKTLLLTLKTIENTNICRNFNDKLEVIVVDDGSQDDTEKMIESNDFGFYLNYIKQVHLGRSQGINMGVENSTGDMIIFCDADILLFSYTIDEIVKRQQEFLHDTVFFGFREDVHDVPNNPDLINDYVMNYKPNFWKDNRFTYDFIGSWGNNMMLESNMMLNYTCKKNIWVSNNEVAMYDCWQLYRMVYGFLFAVSKKNFYKFGGFAEFLVGWGCDDTSFIALCIENGLKIIPVPSAHCLHIYHPIRMKTQWEDGKKNEERMFKYLRNKKRIDFMANNFEERVLCKIKKERRLIDIKPVNIKRKNNDDFEHAKYNYRLGKFEEAKNYYLNIVEKLDIDDLENMLDITIRTFDNELFKKVISLNDNYQKCYFYYLGEYVFNGILNDDLFSIECGSSYIEFAKKIDKTDLLCRAKQYYYEKQWYLSLLDYFAVAIEDKRFIKNCDKCLSNLKERV